MSKLQTFIKNTFISIGILCISFLISFIIQHAFGDSDLIPVTFMLGVFLISVLTKSYISGILSAIISVLAINFAFMFPFFAFDYSIPENIISELILLSITITTCSLTTKIKLHDEIKAESEMERMRANLLRAVSHDLRTPLTTIYGASSAILENYESFSDDQKIKMLNGIKEDSQWLSRMVENLLSVTKLDGANVKIIKTETVLYELIDSVLIKFAKRYPEQNVDVEIPDDFVSVNVDAILIEQVMINILENAVQHAEGMTKLTIKVLIQGGKAIFEISDNGCGIAEEKLTKIFTGCYTSDETPSDCRKNNAGIGLSVCASIIKAHGGNIYVQNAKDGGAVFRFTLETAEN